MSDIEAAFDRIFDPAFNRVTLEKIYEGKNRMGWFCSFVDRLKKQPPSPTVLPYWDANKKFHWYGIAFSESDLQQLGDQLRSFLGPSISNFDGRRAVPNPADPVDQAVFELTGGRYFRFQGIDAKISQKLELLQAVWESQPRVKKQESLRTSGRLLREFYLALECGQRVTAETQLAVLKKHNMISASNVLFLHVSMLATFGEWEELLRLPQLDSLLALRRPLRVTEALIQAVYHQYLAVYESGDIDEAIQAFQEEVWPRYGPLYSVRGHLHSPEVLKSFMLRAVAIKPYQQHAADEIVRMPNQSPQDADFLRQLYGKGTPAPVQVLDPLVQARQELGKSAYETALHWLKQAPKGLDMTQEALRVSYELRTQDANGFAVDCFEQLDLSIQNQLRASRVNQIILQHLYPETKTGTDSDEEAASTLTGWMEWIECVEHHRPVRAFGPEFDTSEWLLSELTESESNVQRLIDGMNRCMHDTSSKEVVQDALPHLLRFLRTDVRWPNPRLLELYKYLMDWVVYTTQGQADGFQVFYDLTESLIKMGINQATYGEILKNAIELLNGYRSIELVDWSLDYLELLVLSQCHDESLCLEVLQAVQELFRKFKRHIEPSQYGLLQLLHLDLDQNEQWDHLVRECGWDTENARQAESNAWSVLNGMNIGLYTLTEQVARKVKTIVAQQAPRARFRTDDSKVKTASLTTLAESSDILIISWQSAKHAATLYLTETWRKKGRQPLLPEGKGSSGIIRCLLDYAKRIGNLTSEGA